MILSLGAIPEFSEAEKVPEGNWFTVTAGAVKVAEHPAVVETITDTILPVTRLVGLKVLEAPDKTVVPFTLKL